MKSHALGGAIPSRSDLLEPGEKLLAAPAASSIGSDDRVKARIGVESSWALIARFLRDWVWPRRLELTTVLIVTALLSAATGGYPLIIKLSFDSLLGGDTGVLPIVLAAVVGVTATRSLFLYLQTLLASKLVIGISTDIRKAAFARLMQLDFARLTREAPGRFVSQLTNEVQFIGNGNPGRTQFGNPRHAFNCPYWSPR